MKLQCFCCHQWIYQNMGCSYKAQGVVYWGYTFWICIHINLVFFYLALHHVIQFKAPCSHLGAVDLCTILNAAKGDHLHHAREVILTFTWQRNICIGNESPVTVLASNQALYFRAWVSTTSNGSWTLGDFRKLFNWTEGDFGNNFLKVKASHMNSVLIRCHSILCFNNAIINSFIFFLQTSTFAFPIAIASKYAMNSSGRKSKGLHLW